MTLVTFLMVDVVVNLEPLFYVVLKGYMFE